MKPSAFVDFFTQQRVSAILRAGERDLARQAMQAAIDGGFRVVEFTLTTPGALELIEEFSAREGVVVGAGTVLTVADARQAVAAGARFLVSPVLDAQVIAAAHALEVAVMPGTHTPTEMWSAHQMGAQLQKLFPAPAGGPGYLRSLRGPMPFLNVVPTNGVDEHNLGAWLDAGARALGFVTSLFDPEDMAKGRFRGIQARAARICAAIEAHRAEG